MSQCFSTHEALVLAFVDDDSDIKLFPEGERWCNWRWFFSHNVFDNYMDDAVSVIVHNVADDTRVEKDAANTQ